MVVPEWRVIELLGSTFLIITSDGTSKMRKGPVWPDRIQLYKDRQSVYIYIYINPYNHFFVVTIYRNDSFVKENKRNLLFFSFELHFARLHSIEIIYNGIHCELYR
jgi:hypothetical protein